MRADDEFGSAWTQLERLTDIGFGKFTSMAIAAGNPAIAFQCVYDDDRSLYYIRADDAEGDTWGTPLRLHFIQGGATGLFNSMAIVNGRPAISYHNAPTSIGEDAQGVLFYIAALNATGSTWSLPRVLDATPDAGEDSSLLVVNGKPSISYLYDDDIGDLRYVRAIDAFGVSWSSPETLDSDGLTGDTGSQSEVNGGAGIVYRDVGLLKLRYIWHY
jgi:hypothetical protein